MNRRFSAVNQKLIIIYFINIIAIAFLAFNGSVAENPLLSFFLYAISFFCIYTIAYKIQPEEGDILFPSASIIFITAIFLRLFFIQYPVSNDVYRYAWEGLVQCNGINPYITSPSELAHLFKEDILFPLITHKNIHTAYPPLALFLFRAISSISYSVFSFKLVFLICDLINVALLMFLLVKMKKPGHWIIIYAWNPLILIYGAGESHFDIVHILFIILSLLCFISAVKSGFRYSLSFLFFGICCNDKIFITTNTSIYNKQKKLQIFSFIFPSVFIIHILCRTGNVLWFDKILRGNVIQ